MAPNKRSPENSKQFIRKRNSFFVKNTAVFKNKRKAPAPLTADARNKNDESYCDSFFVKTIRDNKPSTSSNISDNTLNKQTSKTKKPFDKKKWRLQKYSKKYKLEQWEDKRKKAVLREYYKEIKEDEPKFDVKKIYEQYEEEETKKENTQEKNCPPTREETENENNLNTSIGQGREASAEKNNSIRSVRGKAYKKAHLEYQRLQEEKKKRKEELVRKKAERDEALRVYREKKTEKFKTLSRKTKKGQPIMKNRMEMLLEQIQKSMS